MIIKEFLVGLGFKIDEQGRQKFDGFILGATAKLNSLESVLGTVVDGVQQLSSRMEHLYYSSMRTGAGVENINALQYAFAQMGGSADSALSAVDNIASFIRSTPASLQFFESIGVKTRDANGELLDTTEILTGLGQRLQAMPYYVAKAYAGLVGLDENQLRILMQGVGDLTDEYHGLYRTLGVDAEQAAESSKDLQNEQRKIGAALGVLWDKAIIHAVDGNLSLVQRIRQFIFAHFDDLVKGVDWVLEKLDALMKWFEEGFQAAKEGHFAEWIKWQFALGLKWARLQMTDLFEWMGQQWDQHGDKIKEVLGAVLTWLREALFFALDGMLEHLGWYLEKHLPKGLQWFLGMGEEPPEEALLEAELQREESLRRMTEAGEKIGDAVNKVAKTVSQAIDDAIAVGESHKGSPSDPLGIRNNNPGNLRQWPNATGSNRGFAVFASATDGLSAMADNLLSYHRKGYDTLTEIVNRWAPSSDRNNSAAYINDLSKRLGVDPNAILNLSDPARLQALMSGIILHENGRNPYSPVLIGAVASDRIGSRGVSINQKTEIHVAANLNDVAREVGREVGSRNDDLVRNFGSAIR